MKKIKFMLVALMAVFGFNNAMAAELVNSTQYDTNGFQYVIKSMAKTGDVWTGTVKIKKNTFSGTAITINPTVNITVEGTVSGAPCSGTVTFDIVEIEADGFAGLESVTSITFAEGCKVTAIGAGAFAGTKIANLDLTNTKITTLNKLFEDANTALKTVKLPATLTTVADYALEHCYALNSIDAQACTALVTLGANCFGDNAVETLDLSKTKVAALNNLPFVGKTGESGEKNKTLKNLTLPTTISTLGKGLANLYNLVAVNLQDTKITDIQGGAFENDKALTALTFPTTMQKVRYEGIFKGCASLATLTFYYDNLQVIGSTTPTEYLMTEATAGDGTLSALKTLNFITTDATAYDFTAQFNAGAFGNLTGITSVTIAAGDNISSTVLGANAIALSNSENSAVVLGNLKAAPTAGFIAGPTAAAVAATVTVGEVATAQAQATGIVSGNIGTFTVGKLSAALAVEAIGQAQTIVFGGEITTALTTTGALPNARLTTINFGSVKIADAAEIIPAKAFDEDNAPLLTAVSWTPAEADVPTADVFNQAAFGKAPGVDAAAKITFTTVPGVAALYPGNVTEPNILDDDLFNVIFAFEVPDEYEEITVYGPADAAVYVGYFNIPATAPSNYYIEKKQGDAIITVYSAFVDESDYKIYMDPLMIVDGKFVVEKGQTVVVRSTTSDKVKAYATADFNTMRTYGGVIVNELKFTNTAISADELGTLYYGHGQYVYYMKNPTTATGINFQILGPTQYLFANAVYIVKAGATAARLDVEWLDGANDATAIQAIQNKVSASNDAIYNLAGQKVSASYKGVVIKNGKKYIQK